MNSRYYNANTGRFLTQDSYKGNAYEPWTQHLYTYCGNNPINMVDPTGHIGHSVNFVMETDAGSSDDEDTKVVPKTSGPSGGNSTEVKDAPTSDVGCAKPYQEIKVSFWDWLFNLGPNCYGYVIGYSEKVVPGQLCGEVLDDYTDVYTVASIVTKDLKAVGFTVRDVTDLGGANAKVYEYEYKIALRVCTVGAGDFHFMVQTSDGSWAQKHGTGGNSMLGEIGDTPETMDWNALPIIYDSDIVYMAIGRK